MEKMHANLRECMNYLIQLFYKTDKRYSCTRTKLGKMLSILAFKYACKGMKLFDETIYKYPNCGTSIYETSCLFSNIYARALLGENADGKKMISNVELNHMAYIPERYRDISRCYSMLKADIESLFLNFGAYSHSDLSDELNPIVEYEGICRPDGSIDLKAIAHLDKNQFPNNKVIEYIFKK
jgi:hypothetical protein